MTPLSSVLLAVLAIVEVIFDPHFQTRRTVTNLATSAGFREHGFFGHSLAYVMHFEKPNQPGLADQHLEVTP